MTTPREVTAEARHAYASCPFYRHHWGPTRPSDPPPTAPLDVLAFADAHDDPYGGLLALGLVDGGLFAAYDIEAAGARLLVAAGDADLAWDRAAARNTLIALGATTQDTVLVIERNAHAYQHRIWVAAVQDLKARSSSAEPVALDAWRVRFIAEHLAPRVIVGLGNSTWDALGGSEAERWELLRAAAVIVADDDFAAVPPPSVTMVRRITVAGVELVELEPGGGFVGPADRVYLEVLQDGVVANTGVGELLLTTVQRDACPLVRLRTGRLVELTRTGERQVVRLVRGGI